jgi:hypothetical protein
MVTMVSNTGKPGGSNGVPTLDVGVCLSEPDT